MRSSVLFRPTIAVIAGIFWCGLTGCGNKNASLHGTVTYDGQPVDHGTIVFIPAGDSEMDANAVQAGKVANQINDGKYAFNSQHGVPAGKYRVEITWNKIIGKTVLSKDNVRIETEQLLPEKYNTESTLIREIKSSDSTLDFVLEK